VTPLAAQALPAALPVPGPSAPPAVRRDAGPMLAELHDLHAVELQRFCRWMLHDAEDAADAVQDTWIKAMHGLADGRVRIVAHRPWLYAIARNVCLDRLRLRKRAAFHDCDDSAFGQAPGADEVVEVRQEAAAALALVGALSERQRAALLMREVAGMPMPAIGRALGVTADRAAWAVADARRALEEARAGSQMACQDIRDRLSAGRRGRALKVHLDSCEDCRAHDRRIRARRILAPVLFPLAWLRRLSWPALAKPVAASVAVGLTAAALPVGHPSDRRPAPAAPALAAHDAPRAVVPRFVSPSRLRPMARVAPAARHGRPRRSPLALRAAPAPAAAATRAPASTVAASPAVVVTSVPHVAPVAAAVAPVAAAVVGPVVAAVVPPVRRVVHIVRSAPALSPVSPVLDPVTNTVDRVVGAL